MTTRPWERRLPGDNLPRQPIATFRPAANEPWTHTISTFDGDTITVEVPDSPTSLTPPILLGVFDDEETGNHAVWVRLTPEESHVLEMTLRTARNAAGHA